MKIDVFHTALSGPKLATTDVMADAARRGRETVGHEAATQFLNLGRVQPITVNDQSLIYGNAMVGLIVDQVVQQAAKYGEGFLGDTIIFTGGVAVDEAERELANYIGEYLEERYLPRHHKGELQSVYAQRLFNYQASKMNVKVPERQLRSDSCTNSAENIRGGIALGAGRDENGILVKRVAQHGQFYHDQRATATLRKNLRLMLGLRQDELPETVFYGYAPPAVTPQNWHTHSLMEGPVYAEYFRFNGGLHKGELSHMDQGHFDAEDLPLYARRCAPAAALNRTLAL